MKITLNQNIVLKLSIDKKPYASTNGQVQYEENSKNTAYIIFDNHRESPTGFGVKIAKTKKTYIIQRRVSGGKVIKAKVGNVSDFSNIDSAREIARNLIQVAKDTGQNPNTMARLKLANEITLAEAFAQYREHLTGRPTPAKKNTLKVFDRSVKKLTSWGIRRVRNLSGHEILTQFDSIASKTRTTAEQTFRWANVAVNYAISLEAHNAASQQRHPSLSHNPFSILKLNKKYRSRLDLESAYSAKKTRKPLDSDAIGPWLNAVLGRRKKNRTGCDYLLLSTLWGSRRSEGTVLKWRHLINEAEAAISSYVDLEKRIVFFRNTKNGKDHNLPMTDAVYEILLQRKDLTVTGKNAKWIFPAESKHSKTGHYSDSKSLIKYICEDADIEKISMHDLRRTMGRIAEALTTSVMVKRIINHSDLSNPTSSYTEVEWKRLCEEMQRIELHILTTAPALFNMLLTPKYAMIQV